MLKISKSGRIYTSTSSVQELLSELINNDLLFEVGSLLFLSFETNIRGSMAKMMVETAIPTRPQIFVSTKENSEAFSLMF